MLGFVICPRAEDWAAKVKKSISSMRSVVPDGRYDCGDVSVWTFRTPQTNNYCHFDSNGQVLIAAGTVMLGTLRGQLALKEIFRRFSSAESWDSIYPDLRGSFSLVLANSVQGTVDLLTDRDGLFCCYQAKSAEQVLFGTSLLLLATITHAAIDPVGIQEFVHGGGAVNGRTLFSGVSRVPKATCTAISQHYNRTRSLWQMKVENPYLPDSDDAIVQRMDSLFTSALKTELIDPSRSVGADLTAGTDSRTVLAYLLNGSRSVIASTAGPVGNVDVDRAQLISKLTGIEHYWYRTDDSNIFDQADLEDCIEQCDGSMSPFALMKQRAYFSEKSSRFDILFGGNGGPMFKDHYWLFEFNRINQHREPSWARIAKYSLTEGPVDNALFHNGLNYLNHMENIFLEVSKKIDGANNQKLDFTYFDLKVSSFHAPQFTFANRYMDVYHPMCDANLVEYSISIRPWIRQRARLQSELIYKHNKRLAWVLTDNAVPCVPDTGLRFPLRLARTVRYGRAIKRKLRDFVLNPQYRQPDLRAISFIKSLQSTELGEVMANPKTMRLAPLIELERVDQLREAAKAGGHSGYLQRLLGAEAIVRHVASAQSRL